MYICKSFFVADGMRCEAQFILPACHMLPAGVVAGAGWVCCGLWFLSCTVTQTQLIHTYHDLNAEKSKTQHVEDRLKEVLARPPPILVMSPGDEYGLASLAS